MSVTVQTHKPAWWKSAVVYQVYPASFKDSTGDGSGDLRGITSKLDYLKGLGIDIVWLCPIYKSPLADMGYDISDYQDINPAFGTLEDWDELRDETHKRGMKLVMDLVVNHSSDEHAWFQASRSSKSDPKRDWYYWRPAKYVNGVRKPPNNWKSAFGGSAWEWDEKTQEYYLHIFAVKQPDLNWENPELRKAVFDMMSWWVKKGMDGFRLDAIKCISKTPGLPEAAVTQPDEEFQFAHEHAFNGPKLHPYLQEMYATALKGHDLFTVGEVNHCTLDEAWQYVNQDREEKELQMVFNIDHLDTYGKFFDTTTPPPRDFKALKQAIALWQGWMHSTGGWNSLFLENHDHPRSVGRFMTEDPRYRDVGAKALALWMGTLAGTLYVYQGQEIGMKSMPKEWGIEEYQDINSQNWFMEQVEKRKQETGLDNPDTADLMVLLNRLARDSSRLPMQWDTTPNGGFTTGKPWMRASPDYEVCNVAQQTADPGSVLNFWRKVIALRKEGDLVRKLEGKGVFVAINFAEEEVRVELKSVPVRLGKVVIGNYGEPQEKGSLKLRPYEALMFEITL